MRKSFRIKKIKGLKLNYRDRGLKNADWFEILSDIISKADESSMKSLIEEKTSDKFYLKQALTSPVFKKKLIELAKSESQTKAPPSDTN